jgi:hypothetical protein
VLYGGFQPTGPASEVQTYPATTSRLRIGADAEGNVAFQGEVKEARLYDRALTGLEILALFNNGKQRLSATPKRPPEGEAEVDKYPPAKPYATPQAVFDAVNQAKAKGDHKTFMRCLPGGTAANGWTDSNGGP